MPPVQESNCHFKRDGKKSWDSYSCCLLPLSRVISEPRPALLWLPLPSFTTPLVGGRAVAGIWKQVWLIRKLGSEVSGFGQLSQIQSQLALRNGFSGNVFVATQSVVQVCGQACGSEKLGSKEGLGCQNRRQFCVEIKPSLLLLVLSFTQHFL